MSYAIGMTKEYSEILAVIQGFARAIYAETGRYTTYTEDLHTGDHIGATVTVQMGAMEFEFFRGASGNPVKGYEVPLEQMRDDLADWLVAHRKQEVA